MKQPYYLFVRSKENGIWHFRDSANPKIKGFLGTTNKAEARKLADARYEHPKDLDHNTQMAGPPFAPDDAAAVRVHSWPQSTHGATMLWPPVRDEIPQP